MACRKSSKASSSVWFGKPCIKSRLKLFKPETFAKLTALLASAALWIRPKRCNLSSLKLWMPMEIRVTPAST